MANINIYGELVSASSSGVLADSKSIKGSYMVLSTKERENLSDDLKVDGMRVYDTELKKEYRWSEESSAWKEISEGTEGVAVDDTTIEFNGENKLQIKEAGIEFKHLNKELISTSIEEKASDEKLPSELAVKTYADNKISDEEEVTDKTWSSNKIKTLIDDIKVAKFPNLTIIGSPTINNGQISGFSDENYFLFPFLVNFQNKPFEINFDITTGEDVVNQQNILDSEYGLAFAIRDNKFIMALSTTGTSWDKGELKGTSTVTINTNYRIKITWNNKIYTVQSSTDGGETYTTEATLEESSQPYPKQIIIGVTTSGKGAFGGIINLLNCNLSIAGLLVWQGVSDAGLSTRLAINLSNIDDEGVKRIKEIAGSNAVFEEVTEVPAEPSSQVIYIYKQKAEIEIETEIAFNFTTWAKSEDVNIRWNDDYTMLTATVMGKEQSIDMEMLLELYNSESGPYVFKKEDVKTPESEYDIPLFYSNEDEGDPDVIHFTYTNTTTGKSGLEAFAHTKDLIPVESTSLYQYYNNEFQPLMIEVDYSKVTNKPSINGVTIENDKTSEDYNLFRTKIFYSEEGIGDQTILALVKEQGTITAVYIHEMGYTTYGTEHELTLQNEDGNKYFTYTLNDEIITLSADDVIKDFQNDRNYFTEDIAKDGKLFLLWYESDVKFRIDELRLSGIEESTYVLLDANEADPQAETVETKGAYVTDTEGVVHELQLANNLPLKYTEVQITTKLNLTNLTSNIGEEITSDPGEEISGTLTAGENYGLPSSITFSSAIKNYSYDNSTGEFSFEVPFVNSEITAQASYRITSSIDMGTVKFESEFIEKGKSVSGIITPDEHYTLPSQITVTNCVYTYNSTTGVIKLLNPTEAVEIYITCPPESFNIIKSLEHFSKVDIPDTISYGETLKCDLDVPTGYSFPDSIEVTGCEYTYNSTTGEITLTNAQSDVTIDASAVLNVIRFTAEDAGAKVYLTVDKYTSINSDDYSKGIGQLTSAIILNYSVDDGVTWNTFFNGVSGSSEIVTLANQGDSVLIYGDNDHFATYNSSNGFAAPSFKTTDGKVKVEGKVSGLTRGISRLVDYMFFALFHDNENITSAPELNLTVSKRETVPTTYYAKAFINCINLVNGPKTIDAQEVGTQGFVKTFYNCTSLVRPPIMLELQPVTATKYAFASTFEKCSSINVTTDSTKGTEFFMAYPVTGKGVEENYKYIFYEVGGDGAGPKPSLNVPYYYY